VTGRPAVPGTAYQTQGPWDKCGTQYFWGGPFSSFARVPPDTCLFPAGWYGHPTPIRLTPAQTVEHPFQACKATNLEDFEWILSAPTPQSAKRRGSPSGEDGRRIVLRPDWEDVKETVMFTMQLVKWTVDPFRSLLLATGPAAIAESSPTDCIWGAYDNATKTLTGRNLLGLTIMRCRARLIQDTAETLAAAGHSLPFTTSDPLAPHNRRR
jgi:ribA/ribD-fused uncharacterized protein